MPSFGLKPYTTFPLTLRFRLLPNDRTDVPGKPPACSYCSSGGENTASFWLRKSVPPVPTNFNECLTPVMALIVRLVEPMNRHTCSLMFINDRFWSGLLFEYGLNGKMGVLPSGQRKSRVLVPPQVPRTSKKVGVENSTPYRLVPELSFW